MPELIDPRFEDFRQTGEPLLTVSRTMLDGQAQVRVVLARPMLDKVIGEYQQMYDTGQEQVSVLSSEILRHFCDMTCDDRISELMRQLEDTQSESVEAIIAIGEGCIISTNDVGFDIARRMLRPVDEETELLFDPTYSPVEVFVSVTDMVRHSGRMLPRTKLATRSILQPPNLT